MLISKYGNGSKTLVEEVIQLIRGQNILPRKGKQSLSLTGRPVI